MKKLIVLAALSVAAVFAWPSHHEKSILKDRLWIDHMPRGERDTIDVFAVITRQPIGTFQKTSAWQGSYETFKVVARTCNERGMDFCLEISGASRGAKKYYSREGWEIGDTNEIEAKLAAIAHE